MRKTRSDAVLKNLPPDQYEALVDWLLAGAPYRVIRQRLRDEFDVEIRSDSALSEFWSSECSAALVARRKRACDLADDVASAAEATPGRFDSATIDALKQKAFELAIAPQSDPRDVKNLFTLVLKARSQDLDEQQIALARDRFEFDAAKAALAALEDLRQIAGDRSLDESARVDAVRRRLFGVIPEEAHAQS